MAEKRQKLVREADISWLSQDARSPFVGAIDGFAEGSLVGWAWLPSDPTFKLAIESVACGKVEAVATADILRKDLIQQRIGSGEYGFLIPIPDRFKDGKPHQFYVRVAGHNDFLPGSPVNYEASPKEQVSGCLDGISGIQIVGWARNVPDPESKLVVEILSDGVPVAIGVADQFRGDLQTAALGDGYFGFAIRLPNELCDGTEHLISARIQVTAVPLNGEPLVFRASKTLVGELVDFDGTCLSGWINEPTDPERDFEVELLDNGQHLGTVLTSKAVDDNKRGFRFYLPKKCFDGRVHMLSVYVKEPPFVIGERVEILKPYLTPEDALYRYAGHCLDSCYLSWAARFRYEGLRRRLAQLLSTHESSLPLRGNKAKSTLPAVAPDFLGSIKQLHHAHEQVVRGFRPHQAIIKKDCLPLTFSLQKAPRVSIVIPVHNQFEVTYNCLASIELAANKTSFEIIVVDDASIDDTINIEKIVRGVHVLRNDKNRGFIHSCNRGASTARGEYVVMLNNDTEVIYGWLDEMLHIFETRSQVGLVGAKLLYPDGTLQEAGGIVWSDGKAWNYGRAGNAHDPRYNYTRQVDYISGACIMLPKALWDNLGGFDQAYIPAYYEDTDLAFKVRDKGYRVYYAPFSRVVHFEGISNGTNTTGSGIKKYQAINEPKFKQRWSLAFKYNGRAGFEAAELAKDRGIQYRALVIDYQTPMPDVDAGSYAAIQELRLLQSLGCKLTFVPLNMAFLGGYTYTLQRMGVECVYAPFATSVHEVIQRRGAEFDLVYITRYVVAEQVINQLREHAPQAKIILCNADLHFLRELRAALGNNSYEEIMQSIRTRDAELAVMRKVDLVLSYNEVEHSVIISHNLNSTKVAKAPWLVELPETVPSYSQRKDIAFLGGFGHPPNKEAVEFFVREVMPLLRQQLPDVCFLVYGSNMPKELFDVEKNDDRVLVKGWVADVSEVYDTCRIFVAPLLSGAGLKGKVVDALAHGVPTILSPVAAEGIGLRDGLETRIVREPEEWVDAIVDLYKSQKTWSAMSAAARQFAKTEYGTEKGKQLMRKAMEMVGLSPDINEYVGANGTC